MMTSMNEHERNARRTAYDAMIAGMSMTQMVRASHAERVSLTQRKENERIARQRNGVPKRNVDRRDRPNLWEQDAPRDVHLATDKACHHPLVKCHHKW